MSGKSSLLSLNIRRRMADIDINKVQEEWNTIFDFIWIKNFAPARQSGIPISWYDYCEKYRDGKQDLEETEKLFSSLFDPVPRLFIVKKEQMELLIECLPSLIKAIREGMYNVDSDAVEEIW